MRFGRPRVRWFSRDGCLSAEESIAEGGMPGVGGAMNAELFAARRCNRGEGSDFCGGQRSTGGMLGDDEVEEPDMVGQQPTVERPCPRRSSRCFRPSASFPPPWTNTPTSRQRQDTASKPHAANEEAPSAVYAVRHPHRHHHRHPDRTVHPFLHFFHLLDDMARERSRANTHPRKGDVFAPDGASDARAAQARPGPPQHHVAASHSRVHEKPQSAVRTPSARTIRTPHRPQPASVKILVL